MFLGREGISSHTGFSVVAFVSVWDFFVVVFILFIFERRFHYVALPAL